MLFLPTSTEVVLTRWPFGNMAVIAICTLSTVLLYLDVIPHSVVEAMILTDWSPLGLIGYQLLHGGVFHLFFNMLYLWVFGNAVCETVGSLRYVGIFFLLGVLAGVLHLLFDGSPAVGASGAINGIIGFYLILYPINGVNCFYWILIRVGTVEITGYWLILFWFILDALGAVGGSGSGIAYWAHLGGLFGGMAIGTLCEVNGFARLEAYDHPSLIDALFRRSRRRQTSNDRPKTREELIREHRERQSANPKAPPDSICPCPHCAESLQIPVDMLGQSLTCPSCGGDILIEEDIE